MAKNAYVDGRMHALMDRYLVEPCWDDLCEEFPILRDMETCEQDRRHHGEVFVSTHTRMVIDELLKDPGFPNLDGWARFLLFWTAVFHDSGKPERTRTEDDGSITSRGHSRAGAVIARREMMIAGMPYLYREHMCSLILAHQIPFWLYEQEEAAQTKKAIMLAMELDPLLLIFHARADARGRICHDPEDIKLRVELSNEVFESLDLLFDPYKFANEESMLTYVRREDRHPAYEAHMEFSCEGTIMCGIQGVGKDTWIAENMPGVPVVSLDDMREEMNVDWTDNQGRVVQAVLEAARSHLRAKRDFIWNATNITTDQREKVISLLRDYNARVRIVYLEAPIDVVMKQNSERAASVPDAVIERFFAKLEPPKDWEAHEVVRVIRETPRPKRQTSRQPTSTTP
jgi:predicted kinase